MSRTIAQIAALAILQLGICSSASMSENSNSADMPANTESISDTAELDQPMKVETKAPAAAAPTKAAAENTAAPAAPRKPIALKGKMEPKKDTSKEDEEDAAERKRLADDKEVRANAYMSQDDSNPGMQRDPQIFFETGCRYLKLKKFQAALDAFNKALELNPRYYEASYKKALVYQLTGYDKYAARRYQDVLKYRPDMDEARINLAALHRKHKHYAGAEEQLEMVLAHNFASFEAHYNLANVFVEDNKAEDALREYKVCLKMKPTNPMVHNNLGVLFLQKNYPEEALQEFRRAAQLDPRNQTFTANINATQKMIAEKKNKGLTM